MSSRFKMRLAEIPRGTVFNGLSMDAYDEAGKFVRLIPHLLGEQVEYGKLFAYLFRRFGYPNVGWDPYKDLAKYLLSTPLPDMILSVRPSVCSGEQATDLTFAFLVPEDVWRDVETHARKLKVRRSVNWTTWPDKDPLKKYVAAAKDALSELKRPVRVRDSFIYPLGDTRKVGVKEPPVAGYPSGALGNLAPEEFANLHTAILRLGNGDAKQGIKRALEALHSPSKA